MQAKHKHKLVLQLLLQPRRYFSIKELVFRSNMSAQRIKLLLSGLSKQRLVVASEKSKVRFYRINQRAPGLGELQRLLAPELRAKNKSRVKDYVERVLQACGDVKFAALTGVFVGLPKSQIDVLLVGRVSTLRAERAMRLLQRLVGVELDYAVFTEKEFRSRLYSFDWFIKEIMERDPIVLVDRIRRERGGGGRHFLI